MRAEIVAQDFEIGLALLRVKRQGLPAVAIADSESITVASRSSRSARPDPASAGWRAGS